MTVENATETQVIGQPATAALADWAVELAGAPLPADVEGAVRDRLIDFTANLLGGASRPSTEIFSGYARRFPGSVPIPDGSSSAAEFAALPYGAAAHALECDDTHQPSSSHPGAVTFATLLPLAAATDAPWDRFATAVVAAYEAMCRIGQATGPAAEYARGFHPTGTAGAGGAALAATLLLGGSPAELANAMGIAGSMSSGSMAFLTNGSWTKHLHPGWAAHGGMVAANLALAGFRGPERVLERPYGYFAGHTGDGDPATIGDGLGSRPFALERTSTKAHGCCRYEQAALDAVLELRDREQVAPDDVVSVRVGVLEAGWEIVAVPAEEKRRPRSTVDAQFSMPFGVAAALVHGRASVHEHTEAVIRDPRVEALMDRVECVRDPALEVDFPAKWPASVEMELRDGRAVSSHVDYPRGDPENPFTTEELVDKLHDLARETPMEARDVVVEALLALGHDGTLSAVTAALARAWGAAG